MTAPTPPAARDAGVGERVSVDAAAVTALSELVTANRNWSDYAWREAALGLVTSSRPLATAVQAARAVPDRAAVEAARITKDQAGAVLSAVLAANREHIAAIISGADAVAIDKAEWAIQCACDDYFIALGFPEGDAPADASEAVRDGE